MVTSLASEPASGAAVLFAEGADFLIGQVESCTLRRDPFPHFYVERCFPEAFVACLEENWPSAGLMPTMDETGLVRKRPGTDLRRIAFTDYAEVLGDRQDFWRRVETQVFGQSFLTAMVGRFADVLPHRCGFTGLVEECHSEFFIQEDSTGFFQGPHIDSQQALMTLRFYLPEQGGMDEMGTTLYAPKASVLEQFPDFNEQFHGGYFAFEHFDEITTAAYRRNAMLGFVVQPGAFHGVNPIVRPNINRRSMHWALRAPG